MFDRIADAIGALLGFVIVVVSLALAPFLWLALKLAYITGLWSGKK